MADLSPEEARLIDEHIQRHGVTRIAPKTVLSREAGCAATHKKKLRATRDAKKVRDRRRFKVTSVPLGQPNRLMPADSTGPKFQTKVLEPDGSEWVLKDGRHNSKIGGDVLVGRLRGARIFTLTLPERTTCPRSCPMWRGCYGNSMPHSRRWKPGKELELQLCDEVYSLCSVHEKVLIRLHVLGDFYSFDYLKIWAQLLDEYENLFVFGFTAWEPDTQIGSGVGRLRGAYPDRFMIRHSGRTGTWGSFTIDFPTDKKKIGDAIVCPEQLDAMDGGEKSRHCGNCAVCWSTDKPIVFVEH